MAESAGPDFSQAGKLILEIPRPKKEAWSLQMFGQFAAFALSTSRVWRSRVDFLRTKSGRAEGMEPIFKDVKITKHRMISHGLVLVRPTASRLHGSIRSMEKIFSKELPLQIIVTVCPNLWGAAPSTSALSSPIPNKRGLHHCQLSESRLLMSSFRLAGSTFICLVEPPLVFPCRDCCGKKNWSLFFLPFLFSLPW